MHIGNIRLPNVFEKGPVTVKMPKSHNRLQQPFVHDKSHKGIMRCCTRREPLFPFWQIPMLTFGLTSKTCKQPFIAGCTHGGRVLSTCSESKKNFYFFYYTYLQNLTTNPGKPTLHKIRKFSNIFIGNSGNPPKRRHFQQLHPNNKKGMATVYNWI